MNIEVDQIQLENYFNIIPKMTSIDGIAKNQKVFTSFSFMSSEEPFAISYLHSFKNEMNRFPPLKGEYPAEICRTNPTRAMEPRAAAA